MRAIDMLQMMVGAIRARKSRSALCALGIAIGIAAVVALTSVGTSLRAFAVDTFSQFGTRIIAINPGKTLTQGMGGLINTERPLTLEDANGLTQIPGVEAVVPVVQGTADVEYQHRRRQVGVLGVNHAMPAVWKFALGAGRFLPDEQGGPARPFAVLGDQLRQELFGHDSPIGQRIRIGGERYRVIGVLAPKGQMLGLDVDDMAYIPTDRALSMFNREGVMEIDVTYAPNRSADALSKAIVQQLSRRHQQEDFTLTTQDQMLRTLDRVLTLLTLAIGGLGAISLVVAGVGTLTVMTTAVTERTAEIGLLRALGATERQVLWLFLGETLILSLLGGSAGIGVVLVWYGLSQIVTPTLPAYVDPTYLLAALLLSGLVGLLSGLAPALRAARMPPAQALKDE